MATKKRRSAEAYIAHRIDEAQRQRKQTLSGQEVGPFSLPADPGRRAACQRDFRAFCERYFPEAFNLAWSADHLKAIAKIERAVLHGGLFALAMPRGSGKTTLACTATLWAILYGHRRYVSLLGCTATRGEELLDSIKTALRFNPQLGQDFDMEIGALRALEGEPRRCNGQHCGGEPTRTEWSARAVVFPTIKGSLASGALIAAGGLTGGDVRGQQHVRVDGTVLRPDLVIPDDPQTDETATSPTMTASRVRLLNGAVLGMAGPGEKIAAILPCTVICPGDLADQMLNPETAPEWQGERFKMLYSFPSNEALWEQYARLRAEGLRAGSAGREATEFYGAHRTEMDAGALAAWPERHNADELSAVQHAMNLMQRDRAAFFAEYQNEPLRPEGQGLELLTPEQIAAKANGIPRGVVPSWASHLSAFIDVHGELLYWIVLAGGERFRCHVVEYGTWPPQPRARFRVRDARPNISDRTPGMGAEAAIRAALTATMQLLCGQGWKTETGGELRIERVLCDANWGQMTDTVYEWARTSPKVEIILPSHGKFLGASSALWSDRREEKGEKNGLHWRIPNIANTRRKSAHIIYDTNFWKSFVFSRLAAGLGDPGSMELFGGRETDHDPFIDHLLAEKCIPTTAQGRTVGEWKLINMSMDNHWFDCLVGCCVGLSVLGLTADGTAIKVPARRRYTQAGLMEKGKRL